METPSQRGPARPTRRWRYQSHYRHCAGKHQGKAAARHRGAISAKMAASPRAGHTRKPTMTPLVGLIMGSKSDWDTLQHAAATLEQLAVPIETRVVSAHRTPDLLFEYAAGAVQGGLVVSFAGAGGAAHLPGMAAAKTVLPVLGVPVQSQALNGMDSLLSIVQMPAGVLVGTLAIGKAGAVNAALLAAAMLGAKHPHFREALRRYRDQQTEAVLAKGDPRGQSCCCWESSAAGNSPACWRWRRPHSACSAACSIRPPTPARRRWPSRCAPATRTPRACAAWRRMPTASPSNSRTCRPRASIISTATSRCFRPLIRLPPPATVSLKRPCSAISTSPPPPIAQ